MLEIARASGDSGSATGSPILVSFEVVFVRRIKARQCRSPFRTSPIIHVSMRSCSGATRATSSTSAAGVRTAPSSSAYDNIVGINAYSAAADWLLPIDEGEARH